MCLRRGTSQRNTSKNDDEPMNVVFFHSKLSDMSRESHHRSQVVAILLWPSIFKTLPKPSLGPRKVEIPSKQNWNCDVYSWISNCLLMFIGYQTVPNNFNRSVFRIPIVDGTYKNMICQYLPSKSRKKNK